LGCSSDRLGLANESPPRLRIVSQIRGQHFDGDDPMQRRIERLHHDTHAALTHDLRHFIRAKSTNGTGLIGWLQKIERLGLGTVFTVRFIGFDPTHNFFQPRLWLTFDIVLQMGDRGLP
jgi:hypothetical protein